MSAFVLQTGSVLDQAPVTALHHHAWPPATDSPLNRFSLLRNELINSTVAEDANGMFCLLGECSDSEKIRAFLRSDDQVRSTGDIRHIHGCFVAFYWCVRDNSVTLIRDGLGNLSASFARLSDGWIIASEEQAVARHHQVSTQQDESRIAAFFAFDEPMPGSTFFNDISEIKPGHYVHLTAGTQHAHQRQYCSLSVKTNWSLTDATAIQSLQEHMHAAVDEQSNATTGKPGVSLSGGMDSTVVAGLLQQKYPHLSTCSYRFPTLADCDEGRYLHDLTQKLRLQHSEINADYYAPLGAADRRIATNLNSPERPVYRALRHATLKALHTAGAEQIFVGDYGDFLYLPWRGWLRDCVKQRHYGLLFHELGRHLRHPRRLRAGLQKTVPVHHEAPWLTEETQKWRHSVHDYHPIATPNAARAASLLHSDHVRLGVRLRYPYRYQPLVQWFANLPSHLLYRNRQYKWITRQAWQNLLPVSVLNRRFATHIGAYFKRAIYQDNIDTVKALLDSNSDWETYVRSDYIATVLARQTRPGLADMVLWRVICYILWQDAWKQHCNS